MRGEPRKWLIELRGEKTQEEVADKAGLSRSSYANIESGNRSPSVEAAKRIAGALGFDWTVFFDQKRCDSKQITTEATA